MRGVPYTEMLFIPLSGVNATWDMITCKHNKLLPKKSGSMASGEKGSLVKNSKTSYCRTILKHVQIF